MKIFSAIYFIFFTTTLAFRPMPLQNSFFPFKNELISQPLIDSKTETIIHNHHLLEHTNAIINENSKIVGKKVVLGISSLLPKVDNIGHNVLHANNEFISYILSHDILNDHLKKEIVLASIRLAQQGDDMGSHLLQLYYNIVESCL
mgnify:CR=1 FL=1